MQTKRCDVYGQGSGYPLRGMLIYDGLHYDALALAGALLVDTWILNPKSKRRPALRRAGAGWGAPAGSQLIVSLFLPGCMLIYDGLHYDALALAGALPQGHSL